MTVQQRYALAILEQTGQPGVVTSGATAIYDGQPWINWRTAHALQTRGLAVLSNDGGYVYSRTPPRQSLRTEGEDR